MVLDKKTLKAHLLAEYALQLDGVLEQIEDDQRLNLNEIEEMALKVRQEVGQTLTQTLAGEESGQQAVEVVCRECQQVMRYKGRKRKWLKTRSGDVQIERPYYYCEQCHKGYFPPG
jgi:hypothetical protein